MKKKERYVFGIVVLCLALIFSVPVQAVSYFSVNTIGLDYKRGSYGIYGAGRHGYSFIYVEGIKGNTLRYRNYKFYYSSKVGMTGKKYGKIKTAKLTKATKYFLGNPRRYISLSQKEIAKGNYITGIHEKKFKTMKWIQKVSKNTFSKRQTGAWTYVKVKNGKVQKIVSRLQIGS